MCRRSKVNPVLCAPLSLIKPITNAALFFSLWVAASAQRVPEPDPLPNISFDTRPESVLEIIG